MLFRSVFPSTFLSPSEVPSELRRFVEHRIPKHGKGFHLWMLTGLLTIPFLEMFTSVSIHVIVKEDSRSIHTQHSHLLLHLACIDASEVFSFEIKLLVNFVIAYKSSQYLQSLLDRDLFVPEATESLNEVYNLYIPTTSSPTSIPS